MREKTKFIFKSAILTSIAMIAYFFLLRGMHLDEMPILRLLNFVFIFLGVNYTIEKNITINKETQYWKSFLAGVYATLLSVIISLAILTIYVYYVQPSFINILQNSFFLWKNNFSFPIILFIIFIQGIAASVISAFLIMRYWKKNMPQF